MRRSARDVLVLMVAVLLALAPVAIAPASAQATSAGFRIDDGRLLDANGNDFIMRGINLAHAWFPAETNSFADVKAAGVNTVRVVLSSGDRFERTTNDEVVQIIDACIGNRLICVLELHDTTGFGEVHDAISLDQAVDHWLSMQEQLHGTEAHVIINIGNEPFAHRDVDQWFGATTRAVERLRSAGFNHTLMVDAPNWGQDHSATMRDNAKGVLDADPRNNVIFDIHMFGAFDSERVVRSYIEAFVRAQLPLVVGEFGPTHPSGDTDEDAIFHWAEVYGIGYMGWSWSGNVDPVAELNVVVDFDPDAWTAWGRRLFRGVDGVRDTAVEASVFGRIIVGPKPVRPVPGPLADPSLRVIERIEAEAGVHRGLGMSIRGSGFSGTGYMKGLDTAGDALEVTVFVDDAGEYDLNVGYRSLFGDKQQQLFVNRTKVKGVMFYASREFSSMTISGLQLRAGTNTVMIIHDWGWIDLDYFEVLRPAR